MSFADLFGLSFVVSPTFLHYQFPSRPRWIQISYFTVLFKTLFESLHVCFRVENDQKGIISTNAAQTGRSSHPTVSKEYQVSQFYRTIFVVWIWGTVPVCLSHASLVAGSQNLVGTNSQFQILTSVNASFPGPPMICFRKIVTVTERIPTETNEDTISNPTVWLVPQKHWWRKFAAPLSLYRFLPRIPFKVQVYFIEKLVTKLTAIHNQARESGDQNCKRKFRWPAKQDSILVVQVVLLKHNVFCKFYFSWISIGVLVLSSSEIDFWKEVAKSKLFGKFCKFMMSQKLTAR